MKKSLLFVTCFSLTLGVVSCKKQGCTDPTATNYKITATKDDGSCEYPSPTANTPTPPIYTPNFGGTFAALIALKTITTTSSPIGNYDVNVGTAVAVFSENGGNSFTSAGTVTVDGNALNVQSNESYVYQISSTSPNGISFGSTVNWSGDGSLWPAFTASTTQGFSTIGQISSGNPSTSSNYTLTTSEATNADSVMFTLAGQNANFVKVLAPNTTSYTFSASEVSAAGAGSAIIQVIGLNYDLQNIDTRDYYLINQTVRSKVVTIE